MKLVLKSLFVALALAVGLSNAAETAHHPASHPAQASAAPHGHVESAAVPAVRWQAGEPLARGMRRVRAATQSLSQGAHGRLDSAQIKGVAKELDDAVQEMFAQCRLDAEPDAALHPLLARVLQASARLASGDFDAQALAGLEAVLARYPLLFDDATWSVPSVRSDASTSTRLRTSHARSNSVSS